jgi:hypothetical protein
MSNLTSSASNQSPIEQAHARYAGWRHAAEDLAAATFIQYEVCPAKQHDEEQAAAANGGGSDAEAVLEQIYSTTKNHPEAAAQASHYGVPYLRRLSRRPADRLAVLALHEALEQRCAAADREGVGSGGGVSEEREVVYDDCLLEVIRLVSIDCPERGALLLALRAESSETQVSYDALFERAVQFGNRKAIERDFSRSMHERIALLRSETGALENRVSETRAKLEGIEKRYAERRQADDRRHAEEVAFMKKNNGQLTGEIKRLTLAAQAAAQAAAEEKAAAAAARK